MKYILHAKEVREGEQFTMQNEPIASIDLMERAATALTEHLMQDIDLRLFERILVFCGPGNNGGDGLAVARLLSAHTPPPVSVILSVNENRTTPDFDFNLLKIKDLEKAGKITAIDFDTLLEEEKTTGRTLVIDALFGIGLTRELKGYFAHVANHINQLNAFVVAIDAPSGLFIDRPTPSHATCVHARLTYTFQWHKWAYLSPEYAEICGEVHILDIGMRLPTGNDLPLIPQFIEKEDISHLYHSLYRPQKFAHKGSNGHGMLVAGSQQMPGAAILCATAAMRSGTGKLTVHTTGNVADALAVRLPEVIIDKDIDANHVSVCHWEDYTGITAAGIGPGIGTTRGAARFLTDMLTEVHCRMVLDADALNLMAMNKTLLAFLPPMSILTPHFKEFERLAGISSNHFERIAKLKQFAIRYNVIVILKGADSVIALPDGRLFVNGSGNPGMATAGSGDVLTGILLGLLARGFSPVHAALIGTCLHGVAGDCALETQSVESLIAGDICQNIGKAFREL